MSLFSDYRFPMRKIENAQEMYIVGVSGYNMFQAVKKKVVLFTTGVGKLDTL